MSKNKEETNSTEGSKEAPLQSVQFEAIKPTEVPLTVGFSSSPNSRPSNESASTSLWRQHRLLIVGLPITLAILLGVIFILPSQISAPQIPSDSVASNDSLPNPVSTSTGPSESPWTDAQFAKQRRETQDILAKLLDRQANLESIHVDQWSPDAFDQASATAAEADLLYREQNFEQAQNLYTQALQEFDQLIEKSESVFTSSLESGLSAINSGDSNTAQQNFELATFIHPESSEAQAGLQRSQVLDQVLDLLREGSRHQRNNELEQAKAQFAQALLLDPESQAAKNKLAEIDTELTDSEYAQAMSMGFAAINQKHYEQAIQAFERALKIKPAAGDAKAAIVQAKNERTQLSLQQLIENATTAEQNEQWLIAVNNYDQALKLDGNLVQAKVGKIKAQHRATVDQRLTNILDSPDRLTDEDVFEEYRQLGREVRDMSQKGPKLQSQFEQLEQAMRKALAPVDIVLQSNNETDITLYQVGKLGRFEQHALTLKPGTYTVVGTRNGYRDVRQEFTISANIENHPVTIQCIEPINKG